MTSAGEVEQYAYCPHNWLLARKGVDRHDGASAAGTAEHRRLGRAQARAELDRREYRLALLGATAILTVAAAFTLAAIALLRQGNREGTVGLVIATIVLGLGSSGLVTWALFAFRDFTRRQSAARLVPGRLLASDLAGEAPLLQDPFWGLTGRPDYILQTKSGPVPVEVKTGRTPSRPHQSHRLQVACYLRLLEAEGRRPEYGLLSYPTGVFRVDWDPALRTQLKGLVDRIHASEASGRADRDHKDAARCRGCARRDACAQRLA